MTKKSPALKKPEVSAAGYDARRAPINARLGPDEKIQASIAGKSVVKVIVVPEKLVNIVAR